VPILLAAFAVARHVPDAHRLYDLVFVVVLASVVVQGSSLSWAAQRLGVTPPA
jgi:potassium/hydrogen antiporter